MDIFNQSFPIKIGILSRISNPSPNPLTPLILSPKLCHKILPLIPPSLSLLPLFPIINYLKLSERRYLWMLIDQKNYHFQFNR